MLTTVTIHRLGGSDDVDADVAGCWAIHETIPVSLGGWSLTHIPTGMAFLTGVLHGQAIACRAELMAGFPDWEAVKSRGDMRREHKLQGRALRQKYGDRP